MTTEVTLPDEITIDGRLVTDLSWSFNLNLLTGIWDDTQEPLALGPHPAQVVEITPGTIYVHRLQSDLSFMTWTISHDVVPERNADVWRISNVNMSAMNLDGTFALGQEVCFDGESEFAVHLEGQADAIGGMIHGNEIHTNFWAAIDGDKIDHTISGVFACDRFEMFQRSEMFQPGSTPETIHTPIGPKVFDVGKRWTFTPDNGLTIRVAAHYLATAPRLPIYGLYTGMVCLGHGALEYEAVTAGAYGPFFDEIDLTGTYDGATFSQDDHAVGWGGLCNVDFKVLRGWDSPNRNLRFDPRADRRKIYADFGGRPGIEIGDSMEPGRVYDMEVQIDLRKAI